MHYERLGVPQYQKLGILERPDLGDLEAKNLDSLEDYSLVAKSRALNSLVAPQGGRRILYLCCVLEI